jgi:glutathione S-transferase
MSEPEFKLYYWPQIQGRGEFIRLAFEDAGTPYVDVARLPPEKGGGVQNLVAKMKNHGSSLEPFAPPFLEHRDLLVGQTALVLHHVAPHIGRVPNDERARLRAHQLQLQITDFVAEVHETHHPIASSLYYEDQKEEAARRSTAFVKERLGKFLGYFERVLVANGGKVLVGGDVTYVDLSLFQMIEGLRYAFPRAMKAAEALVPHVVALHDRVASRPNVAAYLASPRRIAFNEKGIFRRYPELDAPA